MNEQRLEVPKDVIGERLDKWILTEFDGLSRSQAQKWIEQGLILVNGKNVDKNYKLKNQDTISVQVQEKQEEGIIPQDIPLDIVYEDDVLLVVNKPKGLVVHPAAGNTDGTLVNALAHHCKGKLATCNGIMRQGIVHRIDKDTSGLLVCAKEDSAYESLAAQVKVHSMDRFYEAVVYGNIKEETGTINLPIGRNPKERKKMAVVSENGKEAITHFKVLRRYEGFTHMQFQLETGRTHQIRVHIAAMGHPVAGDCVYGSKKGIGKLNGQCLHARAIGFDHPVTGERLYFESELPEYFTNFLKTLHPMDLD